MYPYSSNIDNSSYEYDISRDQILNYTYMQQIELNKVLERPFDKITTMIGSKCVRKDKLFGIVSGMISAKCAS